VVVGGLNGQGKSSTLDAIWYALGGQRAMPSEPLRKGQTKGFSRLTLDSGLVITRSITEAGTTLKVESADGAIYKTPQAMLDKMVGAIAFDPMAFSRMEPKRQLETLRSLVKLDTTALDIERSRTFEERTAINRKIRELDDQRLGTPEVAGAPKREISASDLMDKLQKAEEAHRNHSAATREVNRLEQSITADLEEIERRKACIKASRLQLAKTQKAVVGELPDVEALKRQITHMDATNAAVRQNQKRDELSLRIEKGQVIADGMTDRLEEIDKIKAKMIAEAKFPVAGLSFGENGVRFGDVPFEQCSSAEQTRVSVAMALAMNPELRVLLIRDGSLLDENNLRLVAEMAKEADAQVWIETVTSDAGKCAVIIEDGEVKATPA
jgi:energy-coupling factor transporter ATP-binding protein EcfA2